MCSRGELRRAEDCVQSQSSTLSDTTGKAAVGGAAGVVTAADLELGEADAIPRGGLHHAERRRLPSSVGPVAQGRGGQHADRAGCHGRGEAGAAAGVGGGGAAVRCCWCRHMKLPTDVPGKRASSCWLWLRALVSAPPPPAVESAQPSGRCRHHRAHRMPADFETVKRIYLRKTGETAAHQL